MTAETGTYRWMAPEMILRLPYDSKVDVYSFGIVLYELLSGRVPYAELEPMVATNEVSRRGLRPPVPREAGPGLGRLMTRCWCSPAGERPSFTEVGAALPELTAEADEAAQRGAQPFSWTGASSWLARAGGSLRGRRPPG